MRQSYHAQNFQVWSFGNVSFHLSMVVDIDHCPFSPQDLFERHLNEKSKVNGKPLSTWP